MNDRKLTFVIYQNSKDEGNSLEMGIAGGMRAANMNMARQLSKLGNRVVFLCDCSNEGTYSGVEYVNIKSSKDVLERSKIDIFISESSAEPFKFEINAKIKVLRTGLHFSAKPIQFLHDVDLLKKIALFCFKSSWQAETFKKHFGIKPETIFLTRNGYDPSLFKPEIPKIKGRLIYCSTPARGLDVLVELFPKIRKRFRNAELLVFSDYETHGFPRGEITKRYPNLFKKMSQPGIHWLGNVKRPQLMEELQRAYILAYPAHFNETSCSAAIEAQAAGTVPVTTRQAALPETVIDGQSGILIPGNSRSFIYKWRYVRAILDLLQNDQKWLAMSEAGKKRMAESYTWDKIALEWDEFFKKVLND
jgi:glycosyltransferase involved in cell wall biosynthesis